MIDVLAITTFTLIFFFFSRSVFKPKKKKLNVAQMKQLIELAEIDMEK